MAGLWNIFRNLTKLLMQGNDFKYFIFGIYIYITFIFGKIVVNALTCFEVSLISQIQIKEVTLP